MNFIKNILKQAYLHKINIVTVYIIQAITAAISGVVLYFAMDKSIGHSTALDALAKGFDRTVFMDMLNTHGDNFTLAKSVIIGGILFYFFIGTFLHTGLLVNISKRETSLGLFFSNAVKYFIPFLGIATIFTLIALLILGLIIFPFNLLVGDPLVTFSSEKPYVLWVTTLIGVFSVIMIILWGWSISSRLAYLSEGSVFKAIKSGYKTIKLNFIKLFVIGLSIFLLHILFMIGYLFTNADLGAQTWAVVFLGIAMQQVFSLLRVSMRTVGYVGVNNIVS